MLNDGLINRCQDTNCVNYQPGSRGTLLCPSPLRTVRACLQAHGSSLDSVNPFLKLPDSPLYLLPVNLFPGGRLFIGLFNE